tara:strand:+ start:263 stop:739 length:477 start_codon:yes stop_codon:yes gene_type:complete
MEKHSNKRKLYINTKCLTEGINFGDKLYYPSEEVMRKYLLTEEEIVTYTYQGMQSNCWNNSKSKYENVILPSNKVSKSQKRLNKTLERLLWGPMFDYIIFSGDNTIICIIKLHEFSMDCIFFFRYGETKKYKYNISQINILFKFLKRDDLIGIISTNY